MASRTVEWRNPLTDELVLTGELVMIAYRGGTAIGIVVSHGRFYEVELDELIDLATKEKRDDD